MNNIKRITSILFVLAMLVAIINPSALAADDETGDLIVRVYFDNEAIAHRIAATFEPLEAHYEQGYLLLTLDQDEFAQLRGQSSRLGIRIEPDSERMAQEAYYAQLSEQGLRRLIGAKTKAISGFSCYRTIEETYASAQALATNNPQLAQWIDIGDSWRKTQGLGGYDLMVLRLTNSAIPGPKPAIYITSAIHAREYTTAELTTRLAENLVNNYGIDADSTWILDYHEVHFELQTNPDGRKQAETGLLWRKNTNQNYCSPTSNNRGADLNRNFEFQWNCCGGSSSNQCSLTYRGFAPASEPEVQAVQDYAQSLFPDQRGPNLGDAAPLDASGIYLDIHSSGRLLLWPWGFTSAAAPNGPQLQTLGRKLAFFNGHTPQQSIGLYPTDGTTTSFAYGDLGLAAFTYELGTQFFESCNYFENTLVPDNIPSLMYALKVVRRPYQTPAGPDAINLSLDPYTQNGVPAGTLVTLSASIDDTRYNNSNGTESSQSIAAAEYYLPEITPNQPPWIGNGTAIAMTANDGAFNSSNETAAAVINTAGLAEGRYTVYVRGQDSQGNWGAVSALFLDIDNSIVLPTTLFDDDFETEQGWIANPFGSDTASTGQWQRANPEQTTSSGGVQQLGTTVSGNFGLITGPLAGGSLGTHDIDSGVTSIRSPDIGIPAGANNITLSFYAYLAHLNNATSADFLRVTAVGDSSSQLVFEELGSGNQNNASWANYSANLDAFAEQTIYLLIEAADAGGGSLVEAAVDDIQISAVLSTGGNNPPVITSPGNQTNDEGDAVSFVVNASDFDNDPLTFSATGLPANLSINASNGTISGTLANGSAASYNVTVNVSDGADSDSVAFTWTVNDPGPGGQLITVFDDDFESDLGWQSNPSSNDTATTGQWQRGNPVQTSTGGTVQQLDTTVSGSFDLVTGALAGSSVGTHDIDNGVTSVRSPDIAIPLGTDITLSFSYYLAHLNNATSADFLRVTVVGNNSQQVFQELGAGNTDVAAWASFQTNLDTFAGQTVYLLVEAADASNPSLVEAAIDDVVITAIVSSSN